MEKWKRRFLYCLVRTIVSTHNPDLLKKYIEKENEFPEMRETLQAVYDIYSRDPDLVGIYYNAQDKLKNGAYKNEIEKEALEIVFQLAEEVVKKAAEAAAVK